MDRRIYLLSILLCLLCVTACASDIFFYGDSMIAGGEWEMRFENQHIIVRGYIGYRIEKISKKDYDLKNIAPQKIFFMAGINNLVTGLHQEHLQDSFIELFDKLKNYPHVYVHSILPVAKWHKIPAKRIVQANAILQELCKEYGFAYLDLYSLVAQEDGSMHKSLIRKDGIHLNADGYAFWAECIAPLLEEQTQSMSLPEIQPYAKK